MTQDTLTANRRSDTRQSGTYDVYIEIDCDCVELLDAIGLDYIQCEDDDTQNEVALSLTKDEYYGSFGALHLDVLDEQSISAMLLNPELAEYATKLTIYKPNGDKITFS